MDKNTIVFYNKKTKRIETYSSPPAIAGFAISPIRNVNEHVKCKNCGKDIQIEGKQMCNKCLN